MSRREHTNISALTPLQYIESTGTQWIDTGFKLNNNSRVVIDFTVTQYQSVITSALVPFGARYAWANNQFVIFFPVNRQTGVFSCYGNQSPNIEIYNILNNQTHIDANKRNWTITIHGNTYTNTFNSQTFQNQGNCYLFKCNFWNENPNTNGIAPDPTDGNIRMFLCDIYDNGTQVRKFRPYLNAGEPGMLDELNNVWYGNNGTGEFLYA